MRKGRVKPRLVNPPFIMNDMENALVRFPAVVRSAIIAFQAERKAPSAAPAMTDPTSRRDKSFVNAYMSKVNGIRDKLTTKIRFLPIRSAKIPNGMAVTIIPTPFAPSRRPMSEELMPISGRYADITMVR
jgi:hypothetical protein